MKESREMRGIQGIVNAARQERLLLFMGEQRQRKYLQVFQRMEPGAQKALRDIYSQAHNQGDPQGRHVIMAMRAAARYPEIFKLALSNILIRMGLKRASRTGDLRQMAHFSEVRDDFHYALDAFIAPRKHPELHRESDLLEEAYRPVIHNPKALKEVRHFKEQARPAMDRARKHHKTNPGPPTGTDG